MNRLWLWLPVPLLCVPILVGLMGASKAPEAIKPPPPPVKVAAAPLVAEEEMPKLAKEDPIAFLENCVRKIQKEIKSATLTLQKTERVGGSLQDKEIISVWYNVSPHKVFFIWEEGARKAERVLYVEGENKDDKGNSQLLARPKGTFIRRLVGDVVARQVDGEEAKASGRQTLNNFGFKGNAERTLASWKAAQDRKGLKVEYFGEKKIPELNDRVCYVLRRHNDEVENDG
ncbi:MAG: DUF1571 domain-containing protein, partial [Gemmataceae bacterium]